MQKQNITQEHQTFEIVVDEIPTRAGIDPYNKLIDRVADDNTIDITKPCAHKLASIENRRRKQDPLASGVLHLLAASG